MQTAVSDQKPPFIFHNYPLLCLLKLIAAFPLINSYPTQMQKRCWVMTFIVFYVLFCLPSFACAFSLSMVLLYSILCCYNEEHVCTLKIYDYIFIFGDDTCVEQKSNCREFAHMKELSGDRRTSEQLTLAKIRELTSSTTLMWPAAIPLFH